MSSNGIPRASHEPIAIVGIGFRARDAAGPDQLWKLLRGARDVVGVAPTDRWKDVYDPDPLAPGRSVTRWGSFLEHVDEFDCRFFGISPKQAANMDPQHRLLLEVAWEALEDAGMPAPTVAGRRAGVFVGMMFNDYGRLYGRDLSVLDGYTCTANTFAHAANRVSFFFDLHGPSVAVDTNCSGSLVAIHQACQSLATGESEWAIAGGVSLILTPDVDVSMSKASALSPTGRCRTWDDRADGFVRGEGGGLVVLKPLSRAMADGDRVYALILGTATNHTGRGNWIMEPSSNAQRDVIGEACERAGVRGKDLDYVELHGTGTLKGDPIEADGLAMVTAMDRSSTEPCRVGSIKTNLGHLDAAAGVAGLVKTALCIHHRELVPSLHFETPNPDIGLDRLKFRVQTHVEPWPLRGAAPLAGVTAIGFGGTNAHAVLAGIDPKVASHGRENMDYVLPLSARTERARRDLAERYAGWLEDLPAGKDALYDLCHTAAARRTHLAFRLAVTGDSPATLAGKLRSFLEGGSADVALGKQIRDRASKVVFVFPGHGPQWIGMARDLFDVAPFREALDECDRWVRKEVGWSVADELMASPEASRLEESDVVQPVLFSVAMSLARLWQSWGIEPDAVIGHSFGEIAAACVAGAIDLESAARIVCARGRVTRRLEGRGGVAVVEMPAREVRAVLEGYAGLEIGGANSATSTIVTGQTQDLEAFLSRMADENVFARRVKIAYASHSRDVDDVLEEFARAIGFVETRASRIPIHSTVRGAVVDGAGFDRDYWVENLRSPVRFAETIQSMDGSQDFFVEISPHPVLVTPLEQLLRGRDAAPVVVSSLRKGSNGPAGLGASLARLYASGYDPDWARRYPAGRVVSTPSYPWQRERAWLNVPRAPEAADVASHPLLGCHVELSDQRTHVWDAAVGSGRSAFTRDHRVQGVPVLPASLFIEMIVSAASATLGTEALELVDLELPRAGFLPESASYRLQLTLKRDDEGGHTAHVQGRPDGSTEAWHTHATARIRRVDARPLEAMEESLLVARLGTPLSKTECYEALRALGLDYGPAFQGIEWLRREDGEAFASVRLPAGLDPAAYYFHPALHDACLHVAALTEGIQAGSSVLPVRIAKVTLHSRPGAVIHVHVRLSRAGKHRRADVRLANADGAIVQEVLGIELADLDMTTAAKVDVSQWIYDVGWAELSAPPATVVSPLAPKAGWLILADAGGVGDALASRIREHGAEVVVVRQGPAFRQKAESDFEARAQHPGDLRKVIEILRGRPGACARVLHLWSLDLPRHEGIRIEDLDAAILSSCGSAVDLVQALEQDRPGATAPLWWVTRGAQPHRLQGHEMAPLQAPLWGLGRALSQELPGRWGGLVDLDPSQSADEAARLLWACLPLSLGNEDEIVLRGGRMYGARLNRRAAPAETSKMEVRADVTYLVTGGTGGLGLEVARWLAGRGAKHIVLAARTALPAREQWSALASDSPLAAKVRSVKPIEAEGARVEAVALDIADGEAVRRYLDEHRRRGLPPIRGVFHLAGTVDLHDILELDAKSLLAPIRSKVHGTLALHRGLEDAEVFVLFSSASSVIRSPRLGPYAAANAFLDALAHQRRALGRPCISINWGLWSDVGYVEQLGRGAGPSAIRAMKGIPTDVGIGLLERIAGSNDVQTVVWPSSWSEWARLYPAFSRSPFLAHLEETRPAVHAGASPGLSRAHLQAVSSQQWRPLLQGYVHGLLASHLGLPPDAVPLDRALEQLGFDSLQATELKNRIRRDLDVEIPVVRFLGAATIATIANTMMERLTIASAAPGAPAVEARTASPPLGRPVETKSILDGLNGMSGASLDELLKRIVP